jgi:F0F1-type ATP synthase assembly protein I
MNSGDKQNPDGMNDGVRAYRKAAPYVNAVYVFISAIMLFGFIGWWLDKNLQSAPWFMLIGMFAGFGVGFYSLIKTVQKLEKNR